LLRELKSGDVLLCYSIDRLTREGIAKTLQFRDMLKAKGVRLVSLAESWLGDDGPIGELVTSILAWAAQQERLRIRARQRAGIEAAKAKNGGKVPWGGSVAGRRITVSEDKERLIRELVARGDKIAHVSRAVGVSRKHIYTLLRS
jgi:DNA invertase Pin-like site-specific DNA recombinase